MPVGKENRVNGSDKPCSEASIVQALVAMLLDDWRYMLQVLPLEFHLHSLTPSRDRHSLRPNQDHVYVGEGGPRWRSGDSRSHRMPPSDVVSLLFRRQSYVDVCGLPAGPRADEAADGPARRDWWCCVMTATDLQSMGFRRMPQPDGALSPNAGPTWSAPASALHSDSAKLSIPRQVKHMIVLDFEALNESKKGPDGAKKAPASVCGTYDVDSGTEIRPIGVRSRDLKDQPFPLDLRIRALDVVLDVLSQKLA